MAAPFFWRESARDGIPRRDFSKAKLAKLSPADASDITHLGQIMDLALCRLGSGSAKAPLIHGYTVERGRGRVS